MSKQTRPSGGSNSAASEVPTPLALRARDAAAALGISERLLWSMTNQGVIPHLRLGRAVLYPVAGLKAWLDQQSARGGGH